MKKLEDALPFLECLDHHVLDRAPGQDDTTYHRRIAIDTGETEAENVDVGTDQDHEIGIVDVHHAGHQGAAPDLDAESVLQDPRRRPHLRLS